MFSVCVCVCVCECVCVCVCVCVYVWCDVFVIKRLCYCVFVSPVSVCEECVEAARHQDSTNGHQGRTTLEGSDKGLFNLIEEL